MPALKLVVYSNVSYWVYIIIIISIIESIVLVDNITHACMCVVIAIELLSACQAIEFLRPLKTTAPLEEVYKLVRSAVGYV